ncbi:hypothetical protein [Fervidobacterium sp.]
MAPSDPSELQTLEAKRRATLAFLVFLLLFASLDLLTLNPHAAFALIFALFLYLGYAREAGRVLREEAARRLGLAFAPKGELPKVSLGGREIVAVPLLPEGEPEAHGELRGRLPSGHPFRRFEVDLYGARRFGPVGYRFLGTLYWVELPRSFPPLHLAPKGWPTYPRERWPFFLALLGLLGALLALLARHLLGLPALKPGTSLLLLLVFPALFLYLLAAWRAATRELGRRVVLEGELASRFRAWGYWDPIGEDTALGRALFRLWKAVGPFWLRVEGAHLFLAFPGGGPPASPFLSPKAALGRWEERVRRELSLLRELVLSLGDEV